MLSEKVMKEEMNGRIAFPKNVVTSDETISLPSGLKIRIRTAIFTIKVPFMVGIHVMGEHSLTIDFNGGVGKGRKGLYLPMELRNGHAYLHRRQAKEVPFRWREDKVQELRLRLIYSFSGKL